MAASTSFTIARNFCSKATAMVKPPVKVFGLEGRYANALYSAASKTNQLDQVEQDLIAFQQTMKEDPKLREYVVSPIIKRTVMSKALKESSEKLGFATSTSNFLQTMAENGRLGKLDSFINSYKIIMAGHRGDVVCEVVTAKPLDGGQTKQLEAALKAFIKSNEKIKLTTRVDPNIIGGLIVSIGDKFVDLSIASKIKMYTELISTAV